MSSEDETTNYNFIELTADIVAAYVANNSVQSGNLAELIANVHAAVAELGKPAAVVPVKLQPAVNPKKSVHADYIICLDDGKRFVSLKRHLTSLGMTPNEYRSKWGLPDSYPLVASNYAERRSALAKASGLGRKKGAKLVKKKTRKAAVV